METRGQEVHLDKQEARAGATPGVGRYVLMTSLALIVVAFIVIVSTGMLGAPDDTGGKADTRQAVAEQNAAEQTDKAP